MSAMDDFKAVLEEISAKRKELEVHSKVIEEAYSKQSPIHEQLDILYEKKRLCEAAFLLEVESSVK